MKHLFSIYPAANILLLKTENLLNFHARTLGEVFRFLGLEDMSAEISAEQVFSSAQTPKGHPIARLFLNICYAGERKRLAELLPFDIGDWWK